MRPSIAPNIAAQYLASLIINIVNLTSSHERRPLSLSLSLSHPNHCFNCPFSTEIASITDPTCGGRQGGGMKKDGAGLMD